jgi:hypothetical protein
MAKTSSYQKLKQKNQELINDIYKLVKGNELDKLGVITIWRMAFDLNDAIWAESPTIKNTENGTSEQNI